jgi:hypothetical protein
VNRDAVARPTIGTLAKEIGGTGTSSVAVAREAVTGPAVGTLPKDVGGSGGTVESSAAMVSGAAADDLKADLTADDSKTKVPRTLLLKPKIEEMDFDMPKVCQKCFWNAKVVAQFSYIAQP